MSVTPITVVERVVVTAETTIGSDTTEALWDLYRAAFGHLGRRAAARHLLSREEFTLEVWDPRVVKYVARTAAGRVVGLCTLSNDLATVPWISPDFYRARYPAQVARRAVFYCGTAMVDPAFRSTRAFPEMVAALGADVAAVGGILAADMCRFNVDEVPLARMVTLMMGRVWGSVRPVELDRQVYLAWEPDRPVVAP